jgi:hypothetical protein
VLVRCVVWKSLITTVLCITYARPGENCAGQTVLPSLMTVSRSNYKCTTSQVIFPHTFPQTAQLVCVMNVTSQCSQWKKHMIHYSNHTRKKLHTAKNLSGFLRMQIWWPLPLSFLFWSSDHCQLKQTTDVDKGI